MNNNTNTQEDDFENFNDWWNTLKPQYHDPKIIYDHFIKYFKPKWQNPSPPLQEEPFGYIFNGRFYKEKEEMNGLTMSEGNTPVPVYLQSVPVNYPVVIQPTVPY